MIRFAAAGAVIAVAAWLAYPNGMGVKSSSEPPKASAQCNDLTLSYSVNRSGTCSGRGGVREWIE